MRSRILLFLASLILVPSVTYLVILFARGYRPNFTKKTISPTGLLVATSSPDGAQIIVNDKLTSATNSTLSLTPGTYQIQIKKDGFQTWTKKLQLQAEIVTRAAATLFPSVPSLKAITSSQATNPVLSPDGSKIAFLSQQNLYTLDLSESPLGLLNRDPKLLYDLGSKIYNLVWSPDSKQILAISTPSAYLIDINNQQSSKLVASPSGLLTDWSKIRQLRENQKLSNLPVKLQDVLATSAANLLWSPKENKLLYTATASATIPDNLIRQLPGSSTQPQSRHLKPNTLYVYDLEEDRNFAIGKINPQTSNPNPQLGFGIWDLGFVQPEGLQWFPDSSHLLVTQNQTVTILEYDGQNPTVVYSGPMKPGFSVPYPSGHQLLILSNLSQPSPSPTTPPFFNLYAISLR